MRHHETILYDFKRQQPKFQKNETIQITGVNTAQGKLN